MLMLTSADLSLQLVSVVSHWFGVVRRSRLIDTTPSSWWYRCSSAKNGTPHLPAPTSPAKLPYSRYTLPRYSTTLLLWYWYDVVHHRSTHQQTTIRCLTLHHSERNRRQWLPPARHRLSFPPPLLTPRHPRRDRLPNQSAMSPSTQPYQPLLLPIFSDLCPSRWDPPHNCL